MSRDDRILAILGEQEPECYISASELAEKLGRSRANVSSDLNRLYAQGLLLKKEGRPVLYALKEGAAVLGPHTSDESFDRFLKQNPSLFHCGEQAKAAVLYPPNGMHMLLLGETGVGKSMFAEKIYQFAKSHQCVKENGAFVVFNCADYANNPQLLLTQLFGAVKGAYTGADSDRVGLLEEADGGILLLDEVHRLPAEGQEMLFSYIDRRTFRRLGETAGERKTDVILLCATTEQPESALLSTFMRRIPMVIQIPNLERRGLEERLTLISSFFEIEARKLNTSIQVSVNSMRSLLSYHCPSNIGQLKSDVQLLCAHAYSRYVAHRSDGIFITSFNLPRYIRDGLLEGQARKDVWQILSGINHRFITFEPSKVASIREQEPEDIYQIIDSRIADMKRFGMSDDAIHKEMSFILQKYYKQFIQQDEMNGQASSLENYVGSEVLMTAEKVLSLAATRLQKVISDNIRHGITLHIANAIKRVQEGREIVNPRLPAIQENVPELYELALEALKIVESDFRIVFPDDEAGFLALLFLSIVERDIEQQNVEVILIMHGERTASSMAATANQLSGTEIVHGFDMQLDEKPDEIYQRIHLYIEHHKKIKEILLLVDMGSLSDFGYRIEQEFDIRVSTIILISTLHAMEAARKASLGYSLYEVYHAVLSVNELATQPAQGELSEAGASRFFILTICTTGDGSAKIAQNQLKKLDLKEGLVEIIPLQVTDQVRFRQQITEVERLGKIICVIGVFETNLRVRHFSLSSVFQEKGLHEIQETIEKEVSFSQVSGVLMSELKAISDRGLPRNVRATIDRIAAKLGKTLSAEMLIGAFCHIGCMLDRLKDNKPTSTYPNKEALMQKYPQVIDVVTKQCNRLGTEYDVTIPEDEICYLTAFFMGEPTI